MIRHTHSQDKTPSKKSGWLHFLAIFGGLGLTSGSWAIADPPAIAEADSSVYTSAEHLLTSEATAPEEPAPSATSEAPTPAEPVPTFSPLRTAPTVALTASDSPSKSESHPSAPGAAISLIAQQPDQSSAEVVAPEPATQETVPEPAAESSPATADTSQPEPVVPSEISAEADVPPGYNSVFIDPTDYSVGATTAPDSPAVVFSERSTGCQITVGAGQAAPAEACGGAIANRSQATQEDGNSGNGIQVGPVSVDSRGLRVGNTTVISREYFNEKVRPLNVLRRGNEQYIFPLAIPAPITSLFGWRVHPIFGDERFHAGTDLGAPMGTPVLATRDGRVAISDFLGGYGLTVILRHDGNLESRYAHLSQILVQPGEWVKQGEVVGLVGSTGNSTGPHLHFEMRQLTAQGWVAVDPQEILQYGVARLLEIIDNPLQALSGTAPPDPDAMGVPGDMPYRPAQPNAS